MKARYLYNPFTQIAGFRSFIVGITGLLITSYLAFTTGTHFNGLLNIDFARDSDYWVYLMENLSNWFFLSAFLHISGLFLSGSKIRAIDTAGTALLSRIPLILAPLVRTIPVFRSFAIQSWEMYFITALYLVSLIWTVILLFNGFRISCNLRNERLIVSFIISILLSEVCTKLILRLLL